MSDYLAKAGESSAGSSTGSGRSKASIDSSKFIKIDGDIGYYAYEDESMLPDIMGLVSKDLSEPYSIFTYRYFLSNWPTLCTCVYQIKESGEAGDMIATIVSKAEVDRDGVNRGYIAMVAVNKDYRKRGIAYTLVNMNIENMLLLGATEATLEAEIANKGALGLYEKLGFSREEMLGRYYLNGGDAYKLRLKLDKYRVCPTCSIVVPVVKRPEQAAESICASCNKGLESEV